MRVIIYVTYMKILFQKKKGISQLGILFFWKIVITTDSKLNITEQFIPEPFYDYFFIKKGNIKIIDSQSKKRVLPPQSLKCIFSQPLRFYFSTPLILYGVRLSLKFAESFEGEMNVNEFQNQVWVKHEAKSLSDFARQVTNHIAVHRKQKNPYPLFKVEMQESDWLKNFSPRHKRRLYQNTFGLSRKELQNIYNLHMFLEQICDFGFQNPHIIRHLNPEVFYDQPHLNHIFKKITGLSPVEYFETHSVLQDNLMSASYNEIYGS